MPPLLLKQRMKSEGQWLTATTVTATSTSSIPQLGGGAAVQQTMMRRDNAKRCLSDSATGEPTTTLSSELFKAAIAQAVQKKPRLELSNEHSEKRATKSVYQSPRQTYGAVPTINLTPSAFTRADTRTVTDIVGNRDRASLHRPGPMTSRCVSFEQSASEAPLTTTTQSLLLQALAGQPNDAFHQVNPADEQQAALALAQWHTQEEQHSRLAAHHLEQLRSRLQYRPLLNSTSASSSTMIRRPVPLRLEFTNHIDNEAAARSDLANLRQQLRLHNNRSRVVDTLPASRDAIAMAEQQQHLVLESQRRALLERNLRCPAKSNAPGVQNRGKQKKVPPPRGSPVLAQEAPLRKPPRGVLLGQPDDHRRLSHMQAFLRQQIQVFKATEDDISTHTRGRNKPIKIGQVGLRCRHCSRMAVAQRKRGSTYFPAKLCGFYQAAQNMLQTHLQPGVCTEMPQVVKEHFVKLDENKHKVAISWSGKPYWVESAKSLGLVDTEDDGVRFCADVRSSSLSDSSIVRDGGTKDQQVPTKKDSKHEDKK